MEIINNKKIKNIFQKSEIYICYLILINRNLILKINFTIGFCEKYFKIFK